MAAIIESSRYELAQRELLALDKAAGRVIACESGELWITCDGRGEDVILAGGADWRVPSDAELVVSAMRPSVFTVTSPPVRAESSHRAAQLLAALLRWRQPPLASYPVSMLR